MEIGVLKSGHVTRQIVTIYIASLLILYNTTSRASSVVVAERELERYQLHTGEDALLEYLETGVANDFSGEFNDRWDMYGYIAMVLGESKSLRAIPVFVRLIEEPLPTKLHHDLLLEVATNSYNRSWENWDLERLKNISRFRSICATSLANIEDDSVLPALLKYLDTQTPIIEAHLERENPDSALAWSYSLVCNAITLLGSKTGIDALIVALDRIPINAPETIVQYLQICTGQSFGPIYSQPLDERPSEIESWKKWWKLNRNTFRTDREAMSNWRPNRSRPAPETLHDYLSSSSLLSMGGYSGGGYARESAEWLTKNGGNYTQEFRTIVEDRGESALVRKEALEWYTRFAGGDALELLISYAADEGVYGSLFVERLHLQRTAFRLICEKFPEKAVEIAKACMLSGDVVSDSAVHFLMENDDHHRHVAEKFSNIAAVNGRLLAIQLFLRLSEPIGLPVFIDGLKDTSVSIATFAVQGVEKFDLESELPTASREALGKWKTIPHFQLRMIAESSHQNEGKTASILSAIENVDESDPFASRIYFEAWRMLSAESRNITMAGILRCVDNYKASGWY